MVNFNPCNYSSAHEFQHFTKKHQRRKRREQHSSLRRSSIFSDIGPFAGIRARLYSKVFVKIRVKNRDRCIKNCNPKLSKYSSTQILKLRILTRFITFAPNRILFGNKTFYVRIKWSEIAEKQWRI